jgi:hypothetical protein
MLELDGSRVAKISPNNRLAKRRKSLRLHRILRIANQRVTTDSALQPFVTNFFTRLPWGAGQFCYGPNLSYSMVVASSRS